MKEKPFWKPSPILLPKSIKPMCNTHTLETQINNVVCLMCSELYLDLDLNNFWENTRKKIFKTFCRECLSGKDFLYTIGLEIKLQMNHQPQCVVVCCGAKFKMKKIKQEIFEEYFICSNKLLIMI